MKVTVNKYLNARSGGPYTYSACPLYRDPGYVLDIDDVLIGTEIDGNAIWYHCTEDGWYYWSGGVLDTDFFIENQDGLEDEDKKKVLLMLQHDKEREWQRMILDYKGCAVGFKNDKEDDGLAVIIYVSQKRDNPSYSLPGKLNYRGVSVETDIKAIPVISHQYNPYPGHTPCMQLDNDSFFELGGSVSLSGTDNYGSRTLVLEKGNELFLMTCFHVLLNSYKAGGRFPVQNRKENADYPTRTNQAGQPVCTVPVVEGWYKESLDFAVVKLKTEVRNLWRGARITDYYRYDELASLKNVKSIGSSSFIQTGKIIDINANIPVSEHNFRKVLVAEKISVPGDSGGPVVDEKNKLVGYIIGGDDYKTYILPVYPVIQSLHYKIK